MVGMKAVSSYRTWSAFRLDIEPRDYVILLSCWLGTVIGIVVGVLADRYLI
jgi:hypothetical protein